jgi:hypothetical protein
METMHMTLAMTRAPHGVNRVGAGRRIGPGVGLHKANRIAYG